MSNHPLPSKARIALQIVQDLADYLPAGWLLRSNTESSSGDSPIDVVVEISSPSGETVAIAIGVKRSIDPQLIPAATAKVTKRSAELLPAAVPMVAAAYLSPRSRKLLEESGVGYIDTTGNTRINVSTPGLFIATVGADRDPWPQDHCLQSLRGRGAGRALRAIVDSVPPFGVRELATSTGASAATVSRVLDLLGREGLVVRGSRGPVSAVDWSGGIRRWAEDYEQMTSNSASTYLEPRGVETVESRLAEVRFRYAATGAFAAQRFDPIAPARTATLFVDDVTEAAGELGLRETEAGANVILLEPFDPVVFDRTITIDGLTCVAPSQLAVDLLTGPGREPSQGEEILNWMIENEDAWRS